MKKGKNMCHLFPKARLYSETSGGTKLKGVAWKIKLKEK